MTLHLYDGTNFVRREVDTDPLGRAPRKLVTQMLTALPQDVHIWVFEGRGHLTERRAIYPRYKDRPSTMNDGFFAVLRLIRDAFRHTKAMQIDVPGREADDVIAHLVEHYSGQMPIRIHTTDKDLNALLVYPGVTTTAKPIEGVTPEYTRLYKTYAGDPSDKVKGVAGFGPKTWALANKWQLRQATQALVDGRDPTPFLEAANLPEKVVNRILARPEEVVACWQIVGFLPIDPKALNDNLRVGVPNPEAADVILKEFRH